MREVEEKKECRDGSESEVCKRKTDRERREKDREKQERERERERERSETSEVSPRRGEV